MLVVAALFGVATFDVGSAASVALTSNIGNHISVAAVFPPTDVASAVTLNSLGLSCRADITWTPSTSAGVTSYEVRRRSILSGLVTGGPSTVPGSATADVDTPVPLSPAVNDHEWQVRALVNGWPSDWATATLNDELLCVL